VHAEVLLLGGSKSPSYLKPIRDALSNVLPNVERAELPGLGRAAVSMFLQLGYTYQRNITTCVYN
jgi:hypothetical protein